MLETVSPDFFVSWAIPNDAPVYTIHVNRWGGSYPLVELIDRPEVGYRQADLWLPLDDEPTTVGFHALMEALSSAIVWGHGASSVANHDGTREVVVEGKQIGKLVFANTWWIAFPDADNQFRFPVHGLMRQMWLGSTYLDQTVGQRVLQNPPDAKPKADDSQSARG